MSKTRPGGTVTFLVTDLDDSTRPWEDAPADMAAALQAHDAIVRDAIEGHGGYVFATDGDGYSAAFSTAADAVDAAVTAQQLLAHAIVPLGVRMGLHTGGAIERDGNYLGNRRQPCRATRITRTRWPDRRLRRDRSAAA